MLLCTAQIIYPCRWAVPIQPIKSIVIAVMHCPPYDNLRLIFSIIYPVGGQCRFNRLKALELLLGTAHPTIIYCIDYAIGLRPRYAMKQSFRAYAIGLRPRYAIANLPAKPQPGIPPNPP
ncbi:MAG: hypothetical protein F6K65_34305 [Moorea sp. SIO3C2]|nr:hypothetical protein [Moorena sp. SIO3C2]